MGNTIKSPQTTQLSNLNENEPTTQTTGNIVGQFISSAGVTGQQVLAEYDQEAEAEGQTPNPNAQAVATGMNASGQTTWNVVVNQTQDQTGMPTEPSASLPGEVTRHPAFRATQDAVASGDVNTAQSSFSSLFSDSWMNNPNIDINGLIQAVMRNAYEDNQQDLKYYALKVQFYNNLKKNIRGELARARNAAANSEAGGSNSSNSKLTTPFIPGPTWDQNFNGNTTPVTTQQALTNGQQQQQQQLMQGMPTSPSAGSMMVPSTTMPSSTMPSATSTSPGATSTSPGTTSTSPGTTSTSPGTTSTSPGSTSSTTAAQSATGSSGSGLTPVNPPPTFNPPLFGQGSGNSSSASDWQVYQTRSGQYIAMNMNAQSLPGGSGEVRVYGQGSNGSPGGLQDQVWGDPHLDEAGTGLYTTSDGRQNAFDLQGNSSLVLPDGTQIDMNMTTLANGKMGISSVGLVSGSDHYNITGINNQTQSSSNLNDGATYAQQNAIEGAGGGVFLQENNGASIAMYNASTGSAQIVANGNTTSGGQYTLGAQANVTSAQAATGQTQRNVITTSNQLDAYIQNQEDLLQSVGDDAQLAQTDLQNMSQNQQQTLETLSNLSKSFNDLSMAIIRNISG